MPEINTRRIKNSTILIAVRVEIRIEFKFRILIIILFFFLLFQANVRSNAAVNLFQVLDKKIQSNCYESQEVCAGMEVWIFYFFLKITLKFRRWIVILLSINIQIKIFSVRHIVILLHVFNWWCMSQWARFGTSKIFIVPIV